MGFKTLHKLCQAFFDIQRSVGYVILGFLLKISSFFKSTFGRFPRFFSKRISGVFKVLKRIRSAFAGGFLKLLGYFCSSIKSLKRGSQRLLGYVLSPFKSAKLGAFILGVLFGVFFIFLPFEIYRLYASLPNPGTLPEKATRGTTRILDRHGNLLYEVYKDRKYYPIKLQDIPEVVVEATLAIEDDHFYAHHGFRLDSMFRALKAIALDHRLEGASTITQQLVKNVFLSPERTVDRKIREIILAVLVERRYTKDQILEFYLNNISYGGSAWGIEAASQRFFGKSARDLNLAEASLLAGLPSAPSVYSPFGGHLDLAKQRQRKVLDRMVALGYISPEEASEAWDQPLNFVPPKDFIKAPHFVFYVKSQLEQLYGFRKVYYEGITVKTTLDLDLQTQVEQIVKDGVEANKYLGLSNAGAVVLDPQTGEILAYVGSVDFFKESWGAYDVVTALRQPGSSIKPVTYALALSRGYTPATLIEDAPISFRLPGSKPYSPVNYDGRYHGWVTLRQALANSYNIPAVKLADSLGPANIVRLGRLMGLTTWDENSGDFGLAVTLGAKEVRLIDLANVYATLARGGVTRPPVSLLEVTDYLGNSLQVPASLEKEVLDSGVAFLISSILSDNLARSPTFGFHSPLYIPGHQVAVKTGTTDDKRDNWTMGYTPSYVVGVWVGNNDNSPMNRYLASGLTGAAPIWHDVMRVLLADSSNEPFKMPSNVFEYVDPKCGVKEYFLKDSKIPETLCPVQDDNSTDSDKES